MKIKAPDKTYAGTDHYGSTVLKFRDGVADYDGDLPHGVRQYLQGAGYGLGNKNPETVETPAPADPRDSTLVQVGTALRDAAVDPEPEDFLAPINAGKPGEEGNPHGPNVVSPELHASQGVRPVKGGPVEEAEAQEDAESEHAEEATSGEEITDGAPAAPAGNASQEEWAAYATAQGRDVDGLSRNQIRDLFTKE